MNPKTGLVGILCAISLLLLSDCGAEDDQSEPIDAEEVESPTYGIVAFNQTEDAYEKTNVWKYQWEIELDPDLSRDNTFELFKRTEIISVQGHADIHPQIAKQILLEDSKLEQYKDKQLKFKFRIGDKAPLNNVTKFERRLSGWSYGISIGNMGLSDFLFFPGKQITNVKVSREGTFVGSNLEFISFETEEDGVRYKHRVVLEKTHFRDDG
jgi:hypothetical protein